MTIIDTSALLAIVLKQEARERILNALMKASTPFVISAVSLYEAATVLRMRIGGAGVDDLNSLLTAIGVTVADFDAASAILAIDAYTRFGKGLHPAGLNFGDCPVYALAKRHNAPLLFVGNDFSRTDVSSVS